MSALFSSAVYRSITNTSIQIESEAILFNALLHGIPEFFVQGRRRSFRTGFETLAVHAATRGRLGGSDKALW